MLSKRSKYGIQALSYLARRLDEGPQRTATISKEMNIPKKFLENILLDLKKIGLVQSKMGKAGGYSLRKRPEEISLSELIRYLNGPIALLPCVSLNFYERCDECQSEEACRLNEVFIEVRDASLKILNSKYLSDLI